MLLTLSGPLLTLAGIALGVWGTLLMCRAYHAATTLGVIPKIFRVAGMVLTDRMDDARQAMRNASDYGRLNEENRYRTLAGVYLLVFSFLVQLVGGVLIVIDLVVHHH